MALKSSMGGADKTAHVSDELDALEKLLERTKILYEQYFMGIQKMPPAQLHRTAERKILELTQLQVRNTGLRFRLNTLTQKFGVYNTYWKRTLRQIEQGTYIRDIARIKRRAEQSGEDIPEEILAAMPKRMRESILRSRKAAAERGGGRQRGQAPEDTAADAAAAAATGPEQVRQPRKHVHELDPAALDDLDLDAMFDSITNEAAAAVDRVTAPAAARPGAPQPAGRPANTPGPATPPPTRAARPSAPPANPVPPRPATPRPATPVRSGARAVAVPPGMTDEQTRDLYRRYAQARKLVGERGDVSYDSLMRTLNAQAPRIMKQHNASGVEFNVVIKDDKVVLKAKPKK